MLITIGHKRYFEGSVSHYGIPSYVRTDHGGENVDVWRYIIASHNLDYTRAISGSSVHNERIERLWRDVHRCVASLYANTFREMESLGYLDPVNEVDLYCLHYIYQPRINKCISEFRQSWNNHHLSTEGCMSPNQLFVEGTRVIEQQFPQNTTPSTYVDIRGAMDHVTIPRIRFVPCSLLLNMLQRINPVEHCPDNGETLFITALQIVGQH